MSFRAPCLVFIENQKVHTSENGGSINSERHISAELRKLAAYHELEISISHSHGLVSGLLYSQIKTRWGLDIEPVERLLSPNTAQRILSWPVAFQKKERLPLVEWVIREACYKADPTVLKNDFESTHANRHIGQYTLHWSLENSAECAGYAVQESLSSLDQSAPIYFRVFQRELCGRQWWIATAQWSRPFEEKDLFFSQPCTSLTQATFIPTPLREITREINKISVL